VLLTPLEIGPVRLRNRVVSTSHQTSLVHDHLPTPDLVAYHRARAAGGAGAIFIEATAVDPSGLLTSHTLGGFLPGIVAGYRELADTVHEHGTRLFVQLFHGGREQISAAPRAPAVAPSAVPSPRFACEPRALTAAELRALVGGYATAARHCRQGGIDGIEVSMSHGYLIAQFFSPVSNLRDDAYGGAGRLRLAEEILAAVREAAGPELAVGVRLSADELAPEGLDNAACAEIAGALCATGLADFASFVLGHSAYVAASSWIAPPPPAAEAAIAEPLAAVRAAVDVPVIGTTRVVDIDAAARLVASGAADAVGMTRALIADPELVAKYADGRTRDVLACVGCNQGCIGHYHAGVPIGCLVNPWTGRERTLPRRAGPERGLSVLVVGAGPAGVAAARAAADHGDTVTLVERGAEVGGQLRLAARAPAHHELWRRWRRNAARLLEHPAITLLLGAEPDDDQLAGADVVVLATGARPFVPAWAAGPATGDPFVRDRVGGPALVDAWSAIANPAAVAGPVLVADWGGGWDGLDAAEVLAEQGLDVTLACAAPCPGGTLHQYQRNLYLARLDERGIAILHHTEVTGRGLRHLFSGRASRLPDVATIVHAQGRAPEDELWAALEGAPGRVRAGDVLGPRSAEEATLEGVTALQAVRGTVPLTG
jgi:2,4-dienoyl-CoA reductase-like NADH-dependent reductase (Old Yellow Enzyme family)